MTNLLLAGALALTLESGSDPKAVQIANEVMNALGGREAWEETRYLTWNFFGRRTHVWDKWKGDLRFENEGSVTLLNLNTKKGRVWKSGQEVTDPAALEKALYDAESAWINDSYWVFMPYKLEDQGVTLKYLGKGKTETGLSADVLELTFENVGRTPQNKYHVFVDDRSRLVTQWNYYEKASESRAGFQDSLARLGAARADSPLGEPWGTEAPGCSGPGLGARGRVR